MELSDFPLLSKDEYTKVLETTFAGIPVSRLVERAVGEGRLRKNEKASMASKCSILFFFLSLDTGFLGHW